jgi:hypothetical protein
MHDAAIIGAIHVGREFEFDPKGDGIWRASFRIATTCDKTFKSTVLQRVASEIRLKPDPT